MIRWKLFSVTAVLVLLAYNSPKPLIESCVMKRFVTSVTCTLEYLLLAYINRVAILVDSNHTKHPLSFEMVCNSIELCAEFNQSSITRVIIVTVSPNYKKALGSCRMRLTYCRNSLWTSGNSKSKLREPAISQTIMCSQHVTLKRAIVLQTGCVKYL